MDTQLVLRVVGIAALVVSALFAVLAVHYYLTRDIRAVMDDLSGKTRARGVAGVRTSAVRDRKRDATRRAAQTPVATAEEPTTGQRAYGEEPQTGSRESVGAQGMAFDAPRRPAPKPASASATDMAPVVPAAPMQTSFRVTRRVVLMSATQVIATSEESSL